MSTETLQFKTELKQLLHLIIHSLYSHKDIFLRELISNASDAIDTLRFQGLTNHALLDGGSEWKIKIIPDEKNGTLTISDNGIGMTRDAIVENLGTIAKSGTRAFLEALKKADAQERPDLIGQFGVGFYSSFMVADRVTVVSRAAGAAKNEAVKWESEGQGDFVVETVDKESRGTDIILHLRNDSREFLDPWRIRQQIKKYSDFVEHPIVMDVEKEDEEQKKVTTEETLNSRKALWLRPKTEVTQEEYNSFYKHLSHDAEDPARVIHYKGEGVIEFRALLFLPAHRPFDMMGWSETRKGLHLYIQRIFIMDDCEALLPTYLRFVKGVVDSPDLPLNVSREILQQSAPLEKIKSNLVGKILSTLDEWKRKDLETYAKFFKELGPILKEGIQDWKNQQRIAEVCLFESTKTEPGKYVSLDEYLERMPVSQEAIYYLAGESREQIEHSPYLESFQAAGQEVLLLSDPVDEFATSALTEYKGKKLQAVDKGELKTGEIDEAKQKEFAPLLDFLKGQLTEVKDVRLSQRLKESAACLVADEHEMSAHMERLMQRMGRGHEMVPAKKILELNPDNAAVQALRQLHVRNASDARLEKYARLLYDQALIAEGSKLPNPQAFAQRINEILARDAAG